MLAAPLVAAFYREPRLTAVLRVLSVNLFVVGLQNVSRGRLGKSFRFKELTMRDTIAMMSGGVVAIILAIRGFGVWSLVANLVVYHLLQCLFVIRLVRPHYTLHLEKSVLKRIIGYGLPLTGGGLLFQFYDNADYLVVGRMVGAEALGFYTLAFRLATLAHEKIAAVVNRVAFPAFAAMQNDVEQMVNHWFSISRTISLFNAPFLVYLAVNAADLVSLALGEKWLPSVTPLRFLCVVGALRSLVHVIPPILNAVGRTKMVFKFTVGNSVLLPASFAIGCKLGGLTGVGVAWCVVYPGLWLYLLFSLKRVVKFSLRAYFLNLRLALVVASLCLLVMLAAGWRAAPGVERLILRSAVGGITFAACVLSQRNIRDRVLGMLSRLPSPFL
jgi:O-antigen/teichoic acid export membrane protein